jgi:peptidoglycan/LPS O-acetylase OafA/YrhL
VRRFSKLLLSVFVALAACMLVGYLVTGTQGDLIGGWSLNQQQLFVGFTRLLYPFFAGVLLCRVGKLIRIKNAFWWCSLLLLVAFSVPRIGDQQTLWTNGLYDAFCVIVIFPIVVSMGAGGKLHNEKTTRISNFLSALSYPLYITHYPIIYIYTAWVYDNNIPLGPRGLLVGLLVVILSIVLAWACLKLYDEPVREWLRKKWMMKKTTKIPELKT